MDKETTGTETTTTETTDTGFVGSDGTFKDGWTGRDEFKANADTLGRFKSVPELAKGYMEARTKIGKNPDTLVEIPTETSSDEIKAAWSKAHGVPETIEGYEYEMDADLAIKLGPIDDTKMATLREFAKKKNWSQADFKDVLDFYHNDLAAGIDATGISLTEQQAKVKADSIAELKKEWLGAYDDKVNRANAVMRKYGGEEAVAEFNADNSPAMAKFLDNIAEAMSEDTLKGLKGSNALTAEGLNTQIADLRSQQDAIRKENPINFKSDPRFKDIEGRLKGVYQKKPA